MKANNDLFTLIKSMSKTEKRLFRMHCALQKGEKHYEYLFNAMDSQTHYDESALKRSLNSHAVAKHWAVNKKYLYDKILDSMRQGSSRQDADAEISRLFDSYKLLRKKGLVNQSMRFLRQAKKKARTYDLFARLYTILNQEYLDTLYSSKRAADIKLEVIIRERQAVLEIIQNYSFIGDIYSRQKMWLRLHGHIKNEKDKKHVKKIIAPLAKCKPASLLSDTARSLYNITMADFYQLTNEPIRALHFLAENIQLHSAQHNRKPEVGMSELSAYLLLAIKNKRLKDVEKMLFGFHAYIGERSNPAGLLVYERWFFFRLSSFYVKGDFSAACAFVSEELDRFVKNEKTMSRWNKLNNYYAIAYTFFGSGKSDLSMTWLQKIIQSDEAKIETYTFARLLQLIILYERGHHDLLEHHGRSFDVHLKSRKREYLRKIKLPALLRSLSQAPSYETQKIFQRHMQLLSSFKNDAAFRDLEFYFDLTGWIESKLLKIPFDRTLQKRYEKLIKG